MPVNLFFEMFNSLTDYKGMQDDLHLFKVKQFDDSNELSPNFFFLFDQNNIFRKARFYQKEIGHFDFEAVMPFNGKTFIQEDWYMNEDNCKQIDDDILSEGNGFVSFIIELIKTLIGNEDDIMTLLGYNSKNIGAGSKYDGHFLEDDEEFDD